jgi:toxin ParE1/3/4
MAMIKKSITVTSHQNDWIKAKLKTGHFGNESEQESLGEIEAIREALIEIAQYGNENFGVAKSDRYRDQLKQRFFILAEQPLLYPSVNHITRGYRRSVCGVHSIYYRIENNTS